MTKASVNLQDLRRRIYLKAKAEKSWRFWGLYVHVCKMETLREAYTLAKQNDGAPGVDGVTFEAIETQGVPFRYISTWLIWDCCAGLGPLGSRGRIPRYSTPPERSSTLPRPPRSPRTRSGEASPLR